MKAINYLQQYKDFKLQDKSKNTVDAYISDLNKFFNYINKDLESLTRQDIENYKSCLLSKNYKPKTINRKLVSVRQYIDYFNKLENDVKILVDIKLIKIQKQEYLDELLSKNDFERIVRAAEDARDHRALAIFYGMYMTGARVSELLQFKVDDVKKDTVNVRGKGGKHRDLFIPEILKDYLTDYLRSRGTDPPEALFINQINREPMDRQAVHKIIKKYAGLSKVKLTKAHAHNFRHLYCFSLIDMGLSLDEIADLAGHTDINTTRIYTRKTKTELIKTIKKLF